MYRIPPMPAYRSMPPRILSRETALPIHRIVHGSILERDHIYIAERDGMPSSAIENGVVDFVLRPHEIPSKLQEIRSARLRAFGGRWAGGPEGRRLL